MGAEQSQTIQIGGKDFLEVREGTIEQDLRFASLVARLGIDDLVRGDKENASSFARRILDKVLAGGEVLELLACLLVPADAVAPGQEPGDAWNQELADQTKRFLGSLRSAEDGQTVRGLVVSLLLHFFERGIVSLWTSPSSSTTTGNGPDEKNQTPQIPTAGEGGDPGPTSSSSSATGISTDPPGSFDGPSGRP